MTAPRVAEIRQASAADVPAIQVVVHEAFQPYVARIGVAPKPMELDYGALVDAGQVWVAERDDTGVCGAIVLIAGVDHLMLDTIAVSNDVRGTGVGAALMAYAEERARFLGLPSVHLYTNELMWENLKYYPKRGYVEQGRATVGGIYHRVFFIKSVH